MSTFLVGGKAGQNLEQLTAQAGGALQTSNAVELQVNQATSVVNDNGTTRQIYREEVLLLLNLFEQYIIRMSWPYAAS
jgi:hypothetical protein